MAGPIIQTPFRPREDTANAAINAASTQKPKLLDQVRQAIRTRHYSPRTEESYVHWIKRFVLFHNKRHPAEMGEKEIAQFLSGLASEQRALCLRVNQRVSKITK